MNQAILKFGGLAAAIASIVGLWVLIGFPTIATSDDLKKLNQEQVETGIQVYQNKLRFFFLAPPKEDDPVARRFWEEDIAKTRRQLQRYEQRKIEAVK